MKKIKSISFLLLFLMVIIFQSCSSNTKRHIGVWEGVNSKGIPVNLVLDENKNVVLIQNNEVIGGNEFEYEGKKADFKYEIDYSKDPIWLDFVLYEKGTTQEKTRLKGIIRFITDKKMEYRMNFQKGRYENFDPNDKEFTIVLDKVKPK